MNLTNENRLLEWGFEALNLLSERIRAKLLVWLRGRAQSLAVWKLKDILLFPCSSVKTGKRRYKQLVRRTQTCLPKHLIFPQGKLGGDGIGTTLIHYIQGAAFTFTVGYVTLLRVAGRFLDRDNQNTSCSCGIVLFQQWKYENTSRWTPQVILQAAQVFYRSTCFPGL